MHFSRSYGRCDLHSNQSCVLSNDRCVDDAISDVNGSSDNCCLMQNSSYHNWTAVTWYYLHLGEVSNVSDVHLEFVGGTKRDVGLSDDTVSPCANVSASIEPFGTVPVGDELRELSAGVELDTFRISGVYKLL